MCCSDAFLKFMQHAMTYMILKVFISKDNISANNKQEPNKIYLFASLWGANITQSWFSVESHTYMQIEAKIVQTLVTWKVVWVTHDHPLMEKCYFRASTFIYQACLLQFCAFPIQRQNKADPSPREPGRWGVKLNLD